MWFTHTPFSHSQLHCIYEKFYTCLHTLRDWLFIEDNIHNLSRDREQDDRFTLAAEQRRSSMLQQHVYQIQQQQQQRLSEHEHLTLINELIASRERHIARMSTHSTRRVHPLLPRVSTRIG
jgi:hypothetical protein